MLNDAEYTKPRESTLTIEQNIYRRDNLIVVHADKIQVGKQLQVVLILSAASTTKWSPSPWNTWRTDIFTITVYLPGESA